MIADPLQRLGEAVFARRVNNGFAIGHTVHRPELRRIATHIRILFVDVEFDASGAR